VSAAAVSEWVDRAPRQSPALMAAYAGLADAERYVGECHAAQDWPLHREAIAIMIDWHREISRVIHEEHR
jgi:hypothetical protein